MEVNLLRGELEAVKAVDTERGMVITLGMFCSRPARQIYNLVP